MKKKLLVLICIMFLVGVGIGIYLLVDKNSDSTHEHQYKKTVVEATCLEDGYTKYQCIHCDYNYIDQTQLAYGHNYIETVYQPTCEEKGYTHKLCQICNYSEYTDYKDIVEHDITYEIAFLPTCEEDGLEEGYCEMCNEYFTKIIKSPGHTPGEAVSTETYCGEFLVESVSCTECSKLLYEYGHNLQMINQQATCTDKGYTKYFCNNCDYEHVIEYSPINHITSEWEVLYEPTCEKEGKKIKVCILCNQEVDSCSIEIQNHSLYSEIINNQIITKCNNCNYEYAENVNETYFKISLYTLNGDEMIVQYVTPDSSLELPTLEKEGYEFAGWYLDKEYGHYFTEKQINRDINLYAKWEKKDELLEYNENIIVDGLDIDFTFDVISQKEISNQNISQFISVTNSKGEVIKLNINKLEDTKYQISSTEFVYNEMYKVELSDDVKFLDCENNTRYFVTKADNYLSISVNETQNIKYLEISEIVTTIQNDDKNCILLFKDLLDIDDIVIVYENEKDNIITYFEIVNENIYKTYYIYEITTIEFENVFNSYEGHYEDKVNLDEFIISETFEDELTATFIASPLYNQFNEALKATNFTSDEYIYSWSDVKVKPKLSKEDSSLIIQLEVTSDCMKTSKTTGKSEIEFTVCLDVSNIIDLSFKGSFNGVEDFRIILEADNNFKINLYLKKTKTANYEKEFSIFKKKFFDLKEKGQNSEIPNSQGKGKSKTLNIGNMSIHVYGFTLSLDYAFKFNFEMTGEAGVQVNTFATAKIGLCVYGTDNIEIIKDFQASINTSIYVMGKIDTSYNFRMVGTISFLQLSHFAIGLEFGPYAELGGYYGVHNIFDEDQTITFAGYLEFGVGVKLDLSLTLGLKITRHNFFDFEYNIILFEKTWDLFDKRFPVYKIGNHEVPLYFNLNDEIISYEFDCSGTLEIDKLIDHKITIQNIKKFTQESKEVDCWYYLENEIPGVYLERDGTLYVGQIHKKNIEIDVKVVYGDNILHKTVKLNISLNHKEVIVEYLEPTCQNEGHSEYSYCSICNDIISGEKLILPKAHVYTEKEISDETLRSESSCTEKATYWYKCSLCHEISDTTYFNTGELSDHIFANEYQCISQECLSCNQIIPPTQNHNFIDGKCACGQVEYSKELKFEKIDGGYEIIGYTGNSSPIIPTTYLGEPVISIAEDAFFNKSFDTLLIPETVIYIHPLMTRRCLSLTNIEVSEQNQNYASYDGILYSKDFKELILYPEGKKETEFTIPDFVERLGEFSLISNNIKTLNIGSNVIEIAETALTMVSVFKTIILDSNNDYFKLFSGSLYSHDMKRLIYYSYNISSDLEYVEDLEYEAAVPEGVEFIDKYVFACGGDYLTSVTLPSSLKEVGNGAFASCDRLNSVYYDGTIKEWSEIYFEKEEKYGYYYSSNPMHYANNLYCIDEGQYKLIDTLYISEEYSVLPEDIFAYNKFENIVIPNTITKIESNVFYNSNNLINIYYDGSVDEWSQIEFENSSANPMYYATNFYYQNSSNEYTLLTKVVISDDITTIKDYAFLGMKNLIEVQFPNNLEIIGDYSFSYCEQLSDVSLPNSLVEIGEEAFSHCTSLRYVVIPNNVIRIESSAFYNCESMISCTLSNKLEFIGSYAFSNCSSLNSIIIPDSVTTIENGVFSRCLKLVDVTLPSNLVKLSSSLFSGCELLESIIIPASVKIIDNYIFDYCTNLKEIKYIGTVESWCDIEINSFFNAGGHVIDFCLLNEEYDFELVNILEISNSVEEIREFQFYWFDIEDVYLENECQYIETYALPYVIKNLYYSGSVEDWCKLNSGEKRNSIFNNPTSVYFLNNNDYYLATKVTIPSSVEKIEAATFEMFNCLEEIVIEEGVLVIGQYAFSGCNSLKKVYLPKSLKSIEISAFNGDELLNEIYYCGDVDEWCNLQMSQAYLVREDASFYIKNDLGNFYTPTKIVIPKNVTTINDCQFENFNFIDEIVLHDKIESIGISAFEGCTNLKYIFLSSSIEEISENAFKNTGALIIFAEPTSKPSGWYYSQGYRTYSWNPDNNRVFWGVSYERVFEDDSFIYSLDFENNTAEIVLCKSQSAYLEIPSFVDFKNTEYQITLIKDYAFETNDFVKVVYIPNTINTVESNSFKNSLCYAYLCERDSQNTSDSNYTFNKNSSIKWNVDKTNILVTEDAIYILDRFNRTATYVKYIGLSKHAIIPEYVEDNGIDYEVVEISTEAMSYNTFVDTITIPYIGCYKYKTSKNILINIFGSSISYNHEIVTVILTGGEIIVEDAFDNFMNINEIYVPATIKHVEYSGFGNIGQVERTIFIDMPESVSSSWDNYWNRDKYIISWNTSVEDVIIVNDMKMILDDVNKTAILHKYLGNAETVEIPSTITYNNVQYTVIKINNQSFRECTMKYVVIPSTVECIGSGAFTSCHYFEKVYIPNTVKYIEYHAFTVCNSLTIYCEVNSKPSTWSSEWHDWRTDALFGY